MRLVLVECLLGALNQGQHVAHTENSPSHAVGVELLELVQLLAGAGKCDRPTDDFLHAERGTATRVAIEFGQNDTVYRQRLVERIGNTNRVLTSHRVNDEERVIRIYDLRDLADLLHHLGVN